MLRLLLFALLLLPLVSVKAETTVGKFPPPDWVALPEYEIPTTMDSSLGSVRYIASDFQSTSFPWVFIALNLFIISSDSIFLYLSSISSGEETTSEEMVELFRQVPGLVIWTAYMLVSNRVKATFVRRRKTEVATTMTPPPLPAEA